MALSQEYLSLLGYMWRLARWLVAGVVHPLGKVVTMIRLRATMVKRLCYSICIRIKRLK